ITVGENAISGIDVHGRQLTLRKSRRDHAGRYALSKRCYQIGGSRRQFANGRNAAQQLIQSIELEFQFGMKLCEQSGAEEFARGVVVPLSEGTRDGERLLP